MRTVSRDSAGWLMARLSTTWLTPERLGIAARSGSHKPQAIKYVWHCLARYGRQLG
ncbi:hypothetical protein [Kribbella sp. NPDC048915]|uniref:hypothetical protein n=1 Tax=Kribbella sp. NPDC048915 TaxID=3155148 RepID=UPI0034041EE9